MMLPLTQARMRWRAGRRAGRNPPPGGRPASRLVERRMRRRRMRHGSVLSPGIRPPSARSWPFRFRLLRAFGGSCPTFAFPSSFAFRFGSASRNAISPRSAAERYWVARGSLRSPIESASLRRLDQRGMDIGFAADRRRIAERLGDRLDHRSSASPFLFPRSFSISSKAITLAPQVRKSLAVNSLAHRPFI